MAAMEKINKQTNKEKKNRKERHKFSRESYYLSPLGKSKIEDAFEVFTSYFHHVLVPVLQTPRSDFEMAVSLKMVPYKGHPQDLSIGIEKKNPWNLAAVQTA